MSYTYKHVIVIGIDGAGNFYRNSKAPFIRKMFAEGAGTDMCLTSIPTISAECWGSMLLGVLPDLHQLTNGIVSSTPYHGKYPSVFTWIRKAMPEAKMGSFCCWNPINFGILDDADTTQGTNHDGPMTDTICDFVKNEKPTFLFVQFDSVDGAGHTFGYGTQGHLDQLDTVDGYTARIYEACREAGMLEDGLFVVTADHGGWDHGHGGVTDEEKYVFFVASGKTVNTGASVDMQVKDIPAIITHALGVAGNPEWQATVPAGLFTE